MQNHKTKPFISKRPKSRIISALLLALALSFTFAFFVPVEIYIRNQRDFVIGFSNVAVPMFIVALIAAAVIFAVLFLLPEKIYRVFSCLGLGLLLASYVQLLFLNGDMKALTGDDAGYGELTSGHITNAVIWTVIFLLPLLLLIRVKKKTSNEKSAVFGSGKLAAALAGIMFAMQLVGFGSAYFSTELIPYVSEAEYFSFEPLTHLSKQNNIVVFLADRCGADVFSETLERYPDLYEELDGFTFYSDNMSVYAKTFPSVANMLTHQEFVDGKSIADYLDKAWSKRTFIDELHDNGFNVSLILDKLTSYNTIAQLTGIADNIGSSTDATRLVYVGKPSITYDMLKMSFGKLLPYLLKEYFLRTITSVFSNDFFDFSNTEAQTISKAIGLYSDLKFYNYITKNKASADSRTKTFSFVHLTGSHDNHTELSVLYPGFDADTQELTVYTTTRGTFSLINAYLAQLKALNVYDNTTIIILADHGYADLGKAALLIKPQNATGSLQVNSDASLSNAYFAASILEAAGIDTDAYGASYFDLLASGEYPPRLFSEVYWWSDNAEGKPINNSQTWKITGDANDGNNWEAIE
ncbi:MAG: LTA synthase family protein [Oscillospiraceae bacterium]|nr:LTA synthase family protein [Oscillospiraceae bacterium]